MSDPTPTHAPLSHATADPHPSGETRDQADPTGGSGSSSSAASNPIAPLGYELMGVIGHGGMGIVFRARDRKLCRDVAVKVLQEKYSPTSLAARRFIDEARITGQLQHPGIPPIHEVGTLPDGRPFLVMKLIKGRTLADILADGSMNRGSLIAVFEQLCQAVAYAHNHGVIHRDLKPANVMVGAFGEVQVMDWGLAKFRTDARAESTEALTASTIHDPRGDEDSGFHTRTGSFLGTPAYMSPEQAIGALDQIDERSDVFGLGAVLCAILTGQAPFVGESPESARQLAAQKKLEDALKRLGASAAEPELVSLCSRCLAVERDNRPRNASDVAAAVHSFRLESEERAQRAELNRVRVETEAREQRKRWRVQLMLLGTVGLFSLTCGVFAWWLDRYQSRQRERVSRNNDRIEELLKQCEEMLQRDDAWAARLVLEQAERRVAEGAASHFVDRLTRCRTDFDMLNDIDRINDLRWSVRAGKELGDEKAAEELPQAFARYGIVPGSTSVDEAVRKVNGSLIKYRLMTSLDQWLAWSPSNSLLRILQAVDPDEFRNAVRRAIADRDRARLNVLAGQSASLSQPPWFAGVRGGLEEDSDEGPPRLLLAALSRKPGDFLLLMTLGERLDDTPETAREREKWFRAALASRPDNTVALCGLAYALCDQGDLDGAIASCQEALRLSPQNASAQYGIGIALHRKGDLKGAIASYMLTLQTDSSDPTVYHNLGNAQERTGDIKGAAVSYQRAIPLYEKAISRTPRDSKLHVELGNMFEKTGDLARAIRSYEAAVHCNPKDPISKQHLDFALKLKAGHDTHTAPLPREVRPR